MIVKQVTKRKSTGSFGGLVDYIEDRLKLHSDKVENVWAVNCAFDTIEENVRLVEAGQKLYVGDADPNMHLVVSFQEDEHPTQAQLKDIAHELLKSLDIEHHQHICATHIDTNNYHLHIAINRIDHETDKRARLPYSHIKLQKKAAELEEKHTLKQDNHGLDAELSSKPIVNEPTKEEIIYERRDTRERDYTREQQSVAIHKSNTRPARRRTETQKLTSVRNLSQCDMVHHTQRAEVLLQHDEPYRLGEQRETNNQLRREGTGDNGIDGSNGESRTRAGKNAQGRDIESHTGMGNLLGWIKEQALEEIKETLQEETSNLSDLHKVLAKYNLELKERGNGLVIADKTRKLFVKASDVNRDFSKAKLIAKYGKFEPMTVDTKPTMRFGVEKTKYWEDYQAGQNKRKVALTTLKTTKNKLFENLKEKHQKELQQLKNRKSGNKKQLYEELYKSQKRDREILKAIDAAKKHEINEETPYMSYKEYLIKLSLQGDTKALQTLRNTQLSKPRKEENVIEGKTSHKLWSYHDPQITKQGFVIYKLDKENDQSKIIDKGTHLKITNTSDEALLKALEMAKSKYGKVLDINGTEEFKTKVIALTLENKLDISFQDKKMQSILDEASKIPQKSAATKETSMGR